MMACSKYERKNSKGKTGKKVREKRANAQKGGVRKKEEERLNSSHTSGQDGRLDRA